MKPLKLNMSKFKKIAEDKKSTTLRHADGHSLVIAHGGLSGDNRNALKALPLNVADAADAGEAGAIKEQTKMSDGGDVTPKPKTLGQTIGYPMNKGGDAQGTPAQYMDANDPRIPPQNPPTMAATHTPEVKAIPAVCIDSDDTSPKCTAAKSTAMAEGGEIKQSNPKLEESKKCPHCNGGMMMADAGVVGQDGVPSSVDYDLPISDRSAIPSAPIGGNGGAPLGAQVVEAAPEKFNLDRQTEALSELNKAQASQKQAESSKIGQQAAEVDAYNAQAKQAGLPAKPVPVDPAQVNNGAGNVGAPAYAAAPAGNQQQTTADQDPMGMNNLAKGLSGAYGQQERGITNEAIAQGQLGAENAKTLATSQQQLQDLQTQSAQHLQSLHDEYNNTVEDIKNGHIDPNHYLASLSTAGKISTGIGLFLGGIGSALTHQANPAAEFLKQAIDRDVDAQKAELGKKENLLSANMKQFNNLKDATEMTRLQIQGAAANQMQQQAAKSTDPLVRARADQLSGVVEQNKDLKLYDIHRNQMMMNMMNQTQGGGASGADPGDNSQRVSMLRVLGQNEMANAEAAKSVPSIGVAKIPVPEEARKTLTSQQVLLDATNNLQKYVADHGGLAKLDPESRKYAETSALELQQRYRQGVGASVSQGEADTIKQITGSSQPLNMFSQFNVDPKLRALKDTITSAHNVQRRALGLPPYTGSNPQASGGASSTYVSKSFKPSK